MVNLASLSRTLIFSTLLLSACLLDSAIIPVEKGSYTTSFPGTDIAGRNGFPSGTPQLGGTAIGRPVPTNDWWSALLNNNHANNLFNYPLAMRTLPSGLSVGLIEPVSTPNGSTQPLSDVNPVVVGVSGISATRATVDDYSDWTVTIGWEDGSDVFRATSGIGMPFLYFEKAPTDTASVTVNVGSVTIAGEILIITDSQGGANFAVYGPDGSTWTQSGSTYTSTLGGKTYWSMAILPSGDAASNTVAWQQYAYVEPTNTEVSWAYDEDSATLRTDFTTTVTVNEGNGTTVIQGLLPHQWSHLTSDSPALTGQSMSSIRGEIKLLASNTFSTERVFQGILPTLPAVGAYSSGFDPAVLNDKITLLENDTLATWTDSYNEGQVMNRLIQTARAAHEMGNTEARDKMIATVKERLEDWLTAEAGEVAFLFYYQTAWTTLIGYPAGHGQDGNINDHHFHWGYFIHAAAFMEQFEPGWADEWGPMIELLIRDAASWNRSDTLFPFLRSFSPFAGHAWANGFATFPFGNDQESSSESMQFNSALIHWGAITGNTAIRDLGIYLYTTEQTAIEEYWFDINDRTFKEGYGYSVASRIWGNGYDNQTFWTSDIAAAYGIELYPIHGGSLYLGQNTEFAGSLWAEMAQNTGILNQAVNPNLWHDIYWQFLAFTDPGLAIDLYNANPGRNLKFGVSDAQTYYWLHSMNALGQVDSSVTADDPLAVVFDKAGKKTYVAHNYSTSARTVNFSDGESLQVPAGSLATSLDLPFSASISTPFDVASAGSTVPLTVTLEGDVSALVSVEFYDGDTWIGTKYTAPYTFQTGPLSVGKRAFYARLNAGENFAFSNSVTVKVGDTLPYAGVPIAIPGTFQAANYDLYEGGLGQDVTYFDSSIGNNGDYRPNEYVDVSIEGGEGAVVGWIADGEWLEYTIDVQTTGIYSVEFRYASGNPAGGGPFHFELDGRVASPSRSVPTTTGWSDFTAATVNNVELWAGERTLRIAFTGGEFNLGQLTFSYVGPLSYEPPVADAGADAVVMNPASSTNLDGSGSTVSSGGSLTYLWEQISGPAVADIANPAAATTTVDGMDVDGIYRFKLTVSDGTRDDSSEVEILRGELAGRPPTVAILSPTTGATGLAGAALSVNVSASDPDGEVVRVDLFNGGIHLGSLTESPYLFDWYAPEGTHSLTATVIDSDGLSATSTAVSYTANPPVPCRQASASGDFEFEFGTSGETQTITFIPSRAGVGSSIVLLYYGTGGGPYPGYVITPETPFELTAQSGETIGFYFTYSVPEGGERNTIAENTTYIIGSCGESIETDPAIAKSIWRSEHFDAEDLGNPSLESTLWGDLADPDLDGLANYIEFLTGSDPLNDSPSPIYWYKHVAGTNPVIRYSWRSGMPGSMGGLAWSSNLIDWSGGGVTISVVSQRDGIETHEAHIEFMDTHPESPVFARMQGSL